MIIDLTYFIHFKSNILIYHHLSKPLIAVHGGIIAIITRLGWRVGDRIDVSHLSGDTVNRHQE